MFSNDLHKTAEIIQNGGVAIFPTDTVWGMGCSIENIDAIEKFYAIKKRESDKPTAVLVGSVDQAKQYGMFNDQALLLMKAHWPGALTIVVQATERVPHSILGPQKTIGLRLPNFKIVEQLTQLTKCGLVTGSANFSGQPSPFKKADLDPDLLQLVEAVVEGECGGQPPSTVVDCTQQELKILRQGTIQL
ncbi:MAG: L-threonylcarbamoyladenylate synthase [Patescibacteria group bacterium]